MPRFEPRTYGYETRTLPLCHVISVDLRGTFIHLQDSVGDISGEAFLHVDEDHPDADADRRRDGEDEDGGDGLASSEVRLRNVQA